jgi:hypothetical protein
MFSERKTNRPICYPCCCWPQTGKVYCFASYDDSPGCRTEGCWRGRGGPRQAGAGTRRKVSVDGVVRASKVWHSGSHGDRGRDVGALAVQCRPQHRHTTVTSAINHVAHRAAWETRGRLRSADFLPAFACDCGLPGCWRAGDGGTAAGFGLSLPFREAELVPYAEESKEKLKLPGRDRLFGFDHTCMLFTESSWRLEFQARDCACADPD